MERVYGLIAFRLAVSRCEGSLSNFMFRMHVYSAVGLIMCVWNCDVSRSTHVEPSQSCCLCIEPSLSCCLYVEPSLGCIVSTSKLLSVARRGHCDFLIHCWFLGPYGITWGKSSRVHLGF